MEKLSGNSMTTKFSIRLLQKELQDHIQILKKNVPEETVFDLSVVWYLKYILNDLLLSNENQLTEILLFIKTLQRQR